MLVRHSLDRLIKAARSACSSSNRDAMRGTCWASGGAAAALEAAGPSHFAREMKRSLEFQRIVFFDEIFSRFWKEGARVCLAGGPEKREYLSQSSAETG